MSILRLNNQFTSDCHLLKVHDLAYNWPENFNKEAFIIVDPLNVKDKQQDFVLKITGMINSTDNANSELGR